MNTTNQGFSGSPVKSSATIRNIQYLLWLYFWLLIFEGALRKWIVPQLSTPLLIIRDPVVIGAYFLAIKGGVFPNNIFTKIIIYVSFISFLGGLATVIISDGSLTVTLFGLRTNFVHLPLIFLIPKVFTLENIKELGKWVLLLAVPMVFLMVYQFNAPPDAFINRVAGTGEGQQLASALGKIRPPGTFSFITGAAQYFSLVASFLLYGLIQSKTYASWLLAIAGFALVLALTVSGSRTAIGSVGIVILSLVAALLIKPRLALKSYRLLILIGLVVLGIRFIPFFNEGVEVLNTRVEAADVAEAGSGGIVSRFFNGFLGAFSNTEQIPLLGYGLGMGTNAGAVILTGKADKFLLAEGEWPRIILESGLFLGLLYILLRIAIVGLIGKSCVNSASKSNILPLLLFGACAINILNGQFGQPTSLGFAVFGGGLCLAACQNDAQGLQLQ